MKKLLLIHIAIFSFTIPSFAQSYSETYAHARSLYVAADYEEAIPDLRRLLFFDNNSNPEICIMLGDCYNNLRNFNQSLYYYQLAYDLSASDSVRLLIKFNIISIYLIIDKPYYSLTQVFSLPDSLHNNNEFRKNLYMALAYYQIKDFTSSRNYFIKAIKCPDQCIVKIDSVYARAEKNQKLNVHFPMMLSIIPGLGQLYLGEYKASVNSIMLTGFFAYLYFLAWGNLSPLDAVVSIVPWFERYYQGGLLRTKDLAQQKKDRKDIDYYNFLIDLYANQRTKSNSR